MTDKQKYWIADPEGVKAEVEGVDVRDSWTRLRGWTESTPPEGQEFVWLQNAEHGGKQKFSAQAVPLWAPRGWTPCPPPEPVDPATAHQKVAEPVAAAAAPQTPVSTKPAADATSGKIKE